ncbi:MAG: hypothetical protein JWR61_3804 [Ferruginibacter sp.]|uniref:hypothetical protein n=1 Tax=Ferruginibacter sp. TaxID=1940288 RepID=UPI002657AE7A|nr:hypothetical protein [Ferruginibacter sp.]MDB5278849.1 hypothetical protein [Ferruginibacter sp.]
MKNINFKIAACIMTLLLFSFCAGAQYKSFILSPKGDTLNVVDKNNLKQGRWVISVVELRGEPGYDEEGYFKDDKKTGPWRKYNSTGDILAVENYKAGGKEGVQEYFTFLGDLIRHEEWKGYDPERPYDTIAVYGQGNNEVSSYKIVKAEQYSVPNGVWKYYAPGEKFIKAETYDHGRLIKADNNTAIVAKKPADVTGEVGKTKEILEYEKKYSKKKRKQMEREGKTSL